MLGAVGWGENLEQAKKRAYALCEQVHFKSKYFRRILGTGNFPGRNSILTCLFTGKIKKSSPYPWEKKAEKKKKGGKKTNRLHLHCQCLSESDG